MRASLGIEQPIYAKKVLVPARPLILNGVVEYWRNG